MARCLCQSYPIRLYNHDCPPLLASQLLLPVPIPAVRGENARVVECSHGPVSLHARYNQLRGNHTGLHPSPLPLRSCGYATTIENDGRTMAQCCRIG